MVDDKQQSLLEIKVDRIEEQVTKLVRQVEGDEALGVPGLRSYIKANEEWKRTTEHLLQARDRNITVDFKTMWLIGLIVILAIIILFFVWDFFRSGNINPIIAAWNTNYGFNNWVFSNLRLWS